jgi:tetratricopeptide (TPR) repeat protein
MAIAAYQRGDCTEAAMLCRQILSAQPDEFDALHLLGVLELDGPNVDDAERVLQRAVKVRPNSAEAHSNLGLACAKLKKFEEARKNQEMAIALDSNFPIAFTNLGNVLVQLRLPELAVEAHDRAIRIRPDYVDAYSNRGTALLVSDQPRLKQVSTARFHCGHVIWPPLWAKRLQVSMLANMTRHSKHLMLHLRSIRACPRLFCIAVG